MFERKITMHAKQLGIALAVIPPGQAVMPLPGSGLGVNQRQIAITGR
jgi:hypothetical protein